MDARTFTDLLEEHLTEPLQGERLAAFEQALCENLNFRREFEAQSALLAYLSQPEPIEPPAGMHDRIMAAVQRERLAHGRARAASAESRTSWLAELFALLRHNWQVQGLATVCFVGAVVLAVVHVVSVTPEDHGMGARVSVTESQTSPVAATFYQADKAGSLPLATPNESPSPRLGTPKVSADEAAFGAAADKAESSAATEQANALAPAPKTVSTGAAAVAAAGGEDRNAAVAERKSGGGAPDKPKAALQKSPGAPYAIRNARPALAKPEAQVRSAVRSEPTPAATGARSVAKNVNDQAGDLPKLAAPAPAPAPTPVVLAPAREARAADAVPVTLPEPDKLAPTTMQTRAAGKAISAKVEGAVPESQEPVKAGGAISLSSTTLLDAPAREAEKTLVSAAPAKPALAVTPQPQSPSATITLHVSMRSGGKPLTPGEVQAYLKSQGLEVRQSGAGLVCSAPADRNMDWLLQQVQELGVTDRQTFSAATNAPAGRGGGATVSSARPRTPAATPAARPVAAASDKPKAAAARPPQAAAARPAAEVAAGAAPAELVTTPVAPVAPASAAEAPHWRGYYTITSPGQNDSAAAAPLVIKIDFVPAE